MPDDVGSSRFRCFGGAVSGSIVHDTNRFNVLLHQWNKPRNGAHLIAARDNSRRLRLPALWKHRPDSKASHVRRALRMRSGRGFNTWSPSQRRLGRGVIPRQPDSVLKPTPPTFLRFEQRPGTNGFHDWKRAGGRESIALE